MDCDRLLRARLWKLYDEAIYLAAYVGDGAALLNICSS